MNKNPTIFETKEDPESVLGVKLDLPSFDYMHFILWGVPAGQNIPEKSVTPGTIHEKPNEQSLRPTE